MKTIAVKELMVPLKAYATVPQEATLREAIDFVKYGFGFFILSMLLLWLVGFLVVYPVVGFPEGILEQASRVLQSAAVKYSAV